MTGSPYNKNDHPALPLSYGEFGASGAFGAFGAFGIVAGIFAGIFVGTPFQSQASQQKAQAG
jgi:hypothetical protein